MTKESFRRSKAWKDFRKKMISRQKVDAITGSRLTKSCHCHHMDLRAENYFDISEDQKFSMFNSKSHDVVHFFYSSKCGWRQAIKNLEKILEDMERINS